jgi:2-amino-4-hydroxy-6-hydroxymethyldihydropteridine diphosphokinase
MTLAYIGLGSNEEDPRRQVESALDELQQLPATRVVKRSALYRSDPVGYADQPQFVNAVAALETSLTPIDLLGKLQQVEAHHGRRRSFSNAPRTLDLDVLLYGQARIATPELTIPHPRMHERAFVLRPLLEIAPAVSIPGIGEAQSCLRDCGGQAVEKLD